MTATGQEAVRLSQLKTQLDGVRLTAGNGITISEGAVSIDDAYIEKKIADALAARTGTTWSDISQNGFIKGGD